MHVDHPFQSPSILSLCPGFLGLERGLQRAIGKIKVVAYVEIEAFIIANLIAGMEAGMVDAAPVYTDVKTFDPKPFRKKIHGIIGGYPCQPFSLAGQRKGKEDPRHLWPYIQRIIKTAGPVWCLFENVSGHISMGYDVVYKDLRALGYAVEAGIYTAEEAGAPHERERLFILAISQRFISSAGRKRMGWQTGADIGRSGKRSAVGYAAGNNQCNDWNKPGQSEFKAGRPGDFATEQLGHAESSTGRLPECEPGQRRCEPCHSINVIRAGKTKLADTNGESGWTGSEGRLDMEWHTLCKTGRNENSNGSEPLSKKELDNPNSRRCEQCNTGYWFQCITNYGCKNMANANHTRCGEFSRTKPISPEFTPVECTIAFNGNLTNRWPAGPGQSQYDWEEKRTIEPGMGSTIDGYNFREDLLRAFGNSVVEDECEIAFLDLLRKFMLNVK